MKDMLIGQINLSKIDKTKIKTGSDGNLYYNITVKETPLSKYNNFMILTTMSKEEREQLKNNENILGNLDYYETVQERKKQQVPKESTIEKLPF